MVSPDACWRDFVGGISRFGDPSGNGIVGALRGFFLSAFSVIFDYCGAVSAPLVFCSDPNRDPNAEKSGGIIRAGNDEAAKFSEQKGAKMP